MNPETQPTPTEQPAENGMPSEAPVIPQQPVQEPVPQIDQQPEPVAKIHAPNKSGSILAVTEPGEEVIFNVRKHPIGLIVMYLQAIFSFILVGGLLLFTVPGVVDEANKDSAQQFVLLGLVVLGILLFLILLVVTFVYRQNQLLLTNRNITQVIRNGLFDRQVSQLTLNNVEDVTAEKKGIWAMIFNYGQIRVETAGEQNNFHFKYCPSPDHYGQIILDTRAKCRSNSPPH